MLCLRIYMINYLKKYFLWCPGFVCMFECWWSMLYHFWFAALILFFLCFFILYKMISDLPTTVGSRSTKTARGTCLPAPVSLKKVLKESSPPPMVLSEGIWPSGWMPCSRQYSSQQALPIWTPAWPTWMEMHSRWNTTRHSEYQKEIVK